jgi:competence protein ComEC
MPTRSALCRPSLARPDEPAMLRSLLALAAFALLSAAAVAGQADGRFDLYFIDVEGGAATLLVTPAGESVLIDSGYPGNQNRDLDRILHVVRDVARLERIDHAVVSHWHLDHYGNHAALAANIRIRNFWDRGIPDDLQEDKQFLERITAYKAATQNASKPLKAGSEFTFPTDGLPLTVKVMTASREVAPNSGEPNPFANSNQPMPEDKSDNAASISTLWKFGDFTFFTCGDLTWNVEAQLVTPNNPVGKVDLFMVTHHGLDVSNNPTLVHAIDPVVTIMCNGPKKGGAEKTLKTLAGAQGVVSAASQCRPAARGPAAGGADREHGTDRELQRALDQGLRRGGRQELHRAGGRGRGERNIPDPRLAIMQPRHHAIRRLDCVTASDIAQLSEILVSCVEAGASVSFMRPLAPERVFGFWSEVGRAVAAGERILLVAEDSGEIVGTVQIILNLPENQPHRVDVAKLLVHPRARRQGLGEALMHSAELATRAAGRNLMVLDTVTDSAAARLYERLGWTRSGDIPGYALFPDGEPCSTTIYYRQLQAEI